jgi:hypothetical protein
MTVISRTRPIGITAVSIFAIISGLGVTSDPPGPELGGVELILCIQSFEWCFNRLSLAQSRQFGRNVNPPIATLARVSFHLG